MITVIEKVNETKMMEYLDSKMKEKFSSKKYPIDLYYYKYI